MPEDQRPSLPFEASESSERKLWAALSELPRAEPPPGLRREFYRRLERAGAPGWGTALARRLFPGGNPGWLTATACVLLGFGVAQIVSIPEPGVSPRVASLEQDVALLQRELILDRLQDATAAKRLQGVNAAARVAHQDAEIVRALLFRANQDQTPAVRAAAIEALGAQLGNAPVSNELMRLLESTDSPIVQLALVDQVLRHGTGPQLRQLESLANAGRLHSDLAAHVRNSIRSETI
ncbi:MAG: HEAT repeat domain-containing protein [Xanthomonadales bacterium]|nr:HEAT repeat domain-containing protein [Xanthomonadales bacterium]